MGYVRPLADPENQFRFLDGLVLQEVSLHPISLNYGLPRGRRGQPELARGEEAARILARLDALSRPYGTRIQLGDGVGRIALE